MAKDQKESLEALASAALVDATTRLAALGGGVGCDLLLRRKISKTSATVWKKLKLEPSFAASYRKAIQEDIDTAQASELALLEYDAVVEQKIVGVAYTKEIQDFVDSLPARGSEALFAGKESEFTDFNQRAVRISLGGAKYITAFGPSSINPVGQYQNSKLFGTWSSKKEVTAAPKGLLNLGSRVSFFVYENYVFVLNNSNFASMTEFREVVKKRAKQALKKLANLKFLEFDDPAALAKLVDSSPEFAKRISASDARGFLDRLTHAGLLECIKDFAITFEYSDKGGIISLKPDLSDTGEKQQFQKLITGVFVKCAVTGDNLEAPIVVPANKNRSTKPKKSGAAS